MTSISASTITMPSAKLGAPNPLPKFWWQQPTPLQPDPPIGLNDEELEGYIAMGKAPMLPYNVQDDYDRKRCEQEQASIVIENENLRLSVLPHLGGRLYSMVDKRTGRDLVFRNPVFQPANLSIRNAWFSGGIEWNGGAVPGHVASTCSPVFCHRVETERGPILRIHDFDRISETAWQIDLYLPEGAECLYMHGRIVNPNPDARSVYWWTNATTPFVDGMRVVSPADYSIEHVQPDNHLERFRFPHQWGFDGSYPGHWQSATSVFYRPTMSDKPWLVACFPDGHAIVHVATPTLRGRKYFFFGTGKGGVHWSDYLSEPDDGQYVEIQAGLMPTQNQLYQLNAGESVEWTQCIFSYDDCEPVMQADFNDAIELVATRVLGARSTQSLAETDSFLRGCSQKPSSQSFSQGASWGSLHESLIGSSISPGMSFDVADNDSLWQRLAEGKSIAPTDTIPLEFAVSALWEQLLREDKQRAPSDWLHQLLLGIIHLEREEFDEARTAFITSQTAHPSWLSLRCLAILAERCGELNVVEEYYAQACHSESCPYQVYLEWAEFLRRSGRSDALNTLFDNLPSDANKLERIRILRAEQALANGDYKSLKQLLDYPFATIREGELVLSELWQGLVLGEATQNVGRALTDTEAAAALISKPLPFELDFEMRHEVRIAQH